ncbi:MAG: hypothetical protein WDO73_06960 [Ignavibacteriota bacterium]
MKRQMAAIWFSLGAIAAAERPIEKAPKEPFEVASTQRIAFLPGGAIQIDNSYGYLTVEGWDEPEVEIVVTKSADRFLEPERKEQAAQAFEQIHVVAERRSDREVAIATTLPDRHGFPYSLLPSRQIVFTMPKKTRLGVTTECTVHVPRDSRLVVHQDHGYVWVSDVAGDIEVHSHTGDMIVVLPDPGPYSIDARTRLGTVSSDVAGSGHKQFLVGTQFVHAGPTDSRRVVLRMGRGNITIKNGPPSGPFWKN